MRILASLLVAAVLTSLVATTSVEAKPAKPAAKPAKPAVKPAVKPAKPAVKPAKPAKPAPKPTKPAPRPAKPKPKPKPSATSKLMKTKQGNKPDHKRKHHKTGEQRRWTAIVRKAKAIHHRHFSYLWGGGHNTSFSGPYDCSGAVSAVLHAAGYLSGPKVAAEFMHWGKPGPGRVTIFASPTHVYMRIGRHYFGTSSANPGGGAGFFDGSKLGGFVVRHVPLG